MKSFVQAAQRGYEWAYQNPQEAAKILVKEAQDANLDLDFVKASMKFIVDNKYWGDPNLIVNGDFTFGTADISGAQDYYNFIAQSGSYTDENDKVTRTAPTASELATNEFLKSSAGKTSAVIRKTIYSQTSES
ncbi:hypothetical protein RQN30_10860 [Arcanobacterium hippocoleae]